MTTEYILFIIFSLLTIFSSIMVVNSTNPVHSVLFLILAFCNSAAIILSMGVEFLGLVFIVVYVGAIAVLFLFVVMMLNVKVPHRGADLYSLLPVGGIVGMILLFELTTLINTSSYDSIKDKNTFMYIDWLQFDAIDNLASLGQLLYTYYVYYFLIAGFILLVSIVGAIVLTMQVQSGVKRQLIHEQVSRDFTRAIFLSGKTS